MDGLSSSCSSILFLGEGNFSFSRSLSQKLINSRDVRVVATSFEKEEAVCRRKNGRENIDALIARGVTCLFGIDATIIHTCQSLEGQRFDGIIFNFPHIPGKANIAKNRDLLKNFFQSCVQMLAPSGQVLLTLCNGQGGTPADNPQREKQNSWQVIDMATYGDLILTWTVPFRAGEYEEYDSTGYRSQDKGFLTQRAVTHVFERSRVILERHPQESFSANLDGESKDFYCPSDLSVFMKRNLLSDTSHPLSLLNATLVSTIQTRFPLVEVSQECDVMSVTHDRQKDGCSGVYTLQESLNIHEANHSSAKEFKLRPHLCHSLIDRYANKGCVITGKSYHRCAISTDTFPIMHQLFLALPHSDTSVGVVAMVLQGLHDNRSHLQLESRNIEKDVKNESRNDGKETDEVGPLMRRHSEVENKDVKIEKWDQCRVCVEGKINNEQSIQLTDTSGNQTVVGVCGTVTRDTRNYDIILLYLDQLIMHLLHIHDIRLLWSTDTQMWEEFSSSSSKNKTQSNVKSGLFFDTLTPRSKYPPLYVRDVSFWITEDKFDELRFMSVLRQASGLLLQRVWLKEVYHDDTRGDVSRCYRLEYLSCDWALSKEKLTRIHQQLLEVIREEMGLIAR